MLFRSRIKGRPILPRNKVLMIYDMKLWMVCIQPLWQMPPGHKVDLSHPRSILFHAAEPIPKIVLVTVPLFSVIHVCRNAQAFPCFLFSFFCRTHFYPCQKSVTVPCCKTSAAHSLLFAFVSVRHGACLKKHPAI